MTNYYQTKRYPFWLINDFARSQRNFTEPITGHPMTSYNLFYCFDDNYPLTEALGFNRLPHDEALDGDYHHVYELVYIDPSLESLWKEVMDREQEEPYLSWEERNT